MNHVRDTRELNNGVRIPCVGYGTWRIPDKEAGEAVAKALETGYRHIDTAAFYGNEAGIGQAVSQSGLDRKEIFVTSKVWNEDQGYEACKRAFTESLRRLDMEYLDMYLIHWPIAYKHRTQWQSYVQETWRAMEELYEEGKIRAIGVCNFMPHHFEPLLKTAKIKPAVNQIEFHPGLLQQETLDFCKKENILVEAWAPLARQAVLQVEELQKLAEKYGKSPAQITLRWEIQKGIIPLPKSSDPERMLENSRVFDFELTREEMALIDQAACEGTGQHPDHINF